MIIEESTKISFDTAIALIQEASAVIVDGDAVVYPTMVTDDEPEDDYIHLRWLDAESNEYDYSLNRGDNIEVEIVKSTLVFPCALEATDWTRQSKMELTLLDVMPYEKIEQLIEIEKQ